MHLTEDAHRESAEGRVRTWVGLEHLLYCSPEAFRAAMAMAEEFDTGLHTHSSETTWEVEESIKRFGSRPIEEFADRGILSSRTVVAHCVWLDDHEIELLAETGTSVAHCPCSNMKLSSGPARVRDFRAAGIDLRTRLRSYTRIVPGRGAAKLVRLTSAVRTIRVEQCAQEHHRRVVLERVAPVPPEGDHELVGQRAVVVARPLERGSEVGLLGA